MDEVTRAGESTAALRAHQETAAAVTSNGVIHHQNGGKPKRRKKTPWKGKTEPAVVLGSADLLWCGRDCENGGFENGEEDEEDDVYDDSGGGEGEDDESASTTVKTNGVSSWKDTVTDGEAERLSAVSHCPELTPEACDPVHAELGTGNHHNGAFVQWKNPNYGDSPVKPAVIAIESVSHKESDNSTALINGHHGSAKDFAENDHPIENPSEGSVITNHVDSNSNIQKPICVNGVSSMPILDAIGNHANGDNTAYIIKTLEAPFENSSDKNDALEKLSANPSHSDRFPKATSDSPASNLSTPESVPNSPSLKSANRQTTPVSNCEDKRVSEEIPVNIDSATSYQLGIINGCDIAPKCPLENITGGGNTTECPLGSKRTDGDSPTVCHLVNTTGDDRARECQQGGAADGDDTAAESPQDNTAKVVTFAEDKEVFDMGYKQPASITVHLDTPVSSIAHGDVEYSPVSADSAQPPVGDNAPYPLSGILKTEDSGDGKDGDEQHPCLPGLGECVAPEKHFEDRAREQDSYKDQDDDSVSIPKPTELTTDSTLTHALTDEAKVGSRAITDVDSSSALTEVTLGTGSARADTPERGAFGEIPADKESDSYCGNTFGCNATPGEGAVTSEETAVTLASPANDGGYPGEDDVAGPREFIVESVAERELLLNGYHEPNDGAGGAAPSDGSIKPLHPGPYTLLEDRVKATAQHSGPPDAGSHSTDSNYQDTIGPLDNPQFLKTLNYTASQAFDQDDHFGLHSAGLDARSLAGLQEPTDLDGGWAWVVLFASFVGAALLGASVYSAGVLMGAILEEVENDLTKASWVGSVFVCVMSLSGPFVGSLLTRLGARWTVSLAGVVIALGFVGASLATSITQLILTHGIIAGLGAGFTVNPLFVTVGQYFNKYRGFACGVLAMGAGAGMLGGGAFVTYLLSLFDLSGTYLIWAGVMLHVTPVGLLLLPSPEERVRQVERDLAVGEMKAQPDGVSVNSGANSGGNSLFGSVNQSMLSGIDRISIGAHGRRMIIPGNLVSRRPSKLMVSSGPTGSSGGEAADTPLLKAALHNEMSRSSHSVNRPSATHYGRSTLNKSSSDLCGPLSPLVGGTTLPYQTPIIEGRELMVSDVGPDWSFQYQLSSSSNLSPSSNTLNNMALASPSSAHPPPPYPRHSQFRPTSTSQYMSLGGGQGGGGHSQYTSTSHISAARFSTRSGPQSMAPRGELDNESVTSAFVSNLRPRDTLSPRHPLGSRSISTLMGSVASFPTSLAIVKDDLRRFESVGPYDGTLKGYIISILDSMRILRNVPFCIFVTTGFFWALGESPVLIHLPSYVVSRGTSVMQASSLYTSMGVASMAGRFLSGLIASDVNIGPVLLYTGSMGVAGLVITLSPLMTATYAQQVVFSFLVGIYTGALVPLTSLITIELLGIAELSLGFGLISMAQGIGYLVGPPLSSIIVNAIGFVNAFVCSGFVLMLGSLLALSMTLFLATLDGEDEEHHLGLGDPEGAVGGRTEEQHPLGELERALQKLAGDSDSSDLDREAMSMSGDDGSSHFTAEADTGDGLSQASEKSRGTTVDRDTGSAEGGDSGRSLGGTSSSEASRKENDDAPRCLDDCVLVLEDAVPQTAGQLMSVEVGGGSDRVIIPASDAVDVQGLLQCKDELSLPTSIRVLDELHGQDKLDTIVEVIGK